MKVKELILELQKLDGETEIVMEEVHMKYGPSVGKDITLIPVSRFRGIERKANKRGFDTDNTILIT